MPSGTSVAQPAKQVKHDPNEPTIYLSWEGLAFYRSRRFPDLDEASELALEISGDPLYTDVEIIQADRGNGWHVIYRPVCPEAYQSLYAHLQKARVERAVEEHTGWIVRPDERNAGWWWIRTHVGKPEENEYHVSVGSCTCPDYACRCEQAGILCKHVIAVRLYYCHERRR